MLSTQAPVHKRLNSFSQTPPRTDALTGETDRAYESDINNVLVAKTRSTEINFVLGRHADNLPYRRRRQECHHQILEQSIPAFEVDIRPSGEMSCLLQKHRVRPEHFTHVNRHLLHRCQIISNKRRNTVPVFERKILNSL
jgi:hypothetical protein